MAGSNFFSPIMGRIEGLQTNIRRYRANAREIAEEITNHPQEFAGNKSAAVLRTAADTFGNMPRNTAIGIGAATMGTYGATTAISYHNKSKATPNTPTLNLIGAANTGNIVGTGVGAAGVGGFALYRHFMKK